MEIKRLRRDKKLSLRQLATQAGVNYTYLSKIERGKVSPPKQPIIKRIARALDAPAESFYLLAYGQGSLAGFYQSLQLLAQIVAQFNVSRMRDVIGSLKGPSDDGSFAIDVHKASARFSDFSASSKWRLIDFLYLVFRQNLQFEIEGIETAKSFLRSGKRVLFVVKHRDLPSLVAYLLESRPDLMGLDGLLLMRSDSEDGKEALNFLKRAHLQLVDIARPPRSASNGKSVRALSFRRFIKAVRRAERGFAGVMVIDRRKKRANEPSAGPIIAANRCRAIILPVVARNKLEVVMERSWDKRRIPLSSGKLYIGRPFEFSAGSGQSWRKREVEDLAHELEHLDKTAAESLSPVQLRIGL